MDKNLCQEIEKRQLTRFGLVKKIAEVRRLRKIIEWISPEKRKRGGPWIICCDGRSND